AVWAELWSTPQACAWSLERWRWPVVADLCRRMVESEQPATPVAVATAIRQLRDDLGLSTAGLKQHGWAIAKDEIAARRQQQEPAAAAPTSPKPQRRLRDASAQR
ncbi:MAG: hypothetical protein JWO46_1711, partial [Nocardioidaceae bacterium]|nr:hypothetical protein [Nocardioidaceae bacterium]